MKLVTILGARPQFIKAAALSRELALWPQMQEVIVHTGQHFDPLMSDIFFQQMEIPQPKYQLGIHNLSHGAMTGRMLEGIEKILQTENPDWVVVYGDTNSTLAGALAASKLHIPIAHIEAGLRSFNMQMPEEINRLLTDQVAKLLLCPTEQAIKNLQQEGFMHRPCHIVQTGDIMLDAASYYAQKSSLPKQLPTSILNQDFILCTVHRAENTNDPVRLRNIFSGLKNLASKEPIVVPLHPRTRQYLNSEDLSSLHVIEPIGYQEMLALLQKCHMVITDSGGLQKESYFFKKPCITLRNETEWIELVDSGSNILVGADVNKIQQAYDHFQKQPPLFQQNFYGEGQAAKQIIDALLRTAKL